MADRVSPEVRSRNMSRIRGRDTKPELALRTALYKRGLRYRLCRRDLPGTPDIVFMGRKVAVQVRGCFWHQHPGCSQARIPSSNEQYWGPKLARTVMRDRANDQKLTDMGWTLLVFWECGLKTDDAVEGAAREIQEAVYAEDKG